MTCSRERFCALSRASSSSSTVAASEAALALALLRLRQRAPQTRASGGSPSRERTGFAAERNSYRELLSVR